MRNNLYRYLLRFVIALSIVFVVAILGSALIVSSSVRQQNLSAMRTVAEVLDALLGFRLESELADALNLTPLGGSEFLITVYAPDGTVLADSRLPIRNQWIPNDRDAFARVLAGEQFIGKGRSPLHRLEVFRLLYPIERAGRVIALIQVALPLRVINGSVLDYTAPLMFLSLLLFLLAAVYILYGIRTLHRPIVEIISAAERFSAGELDYPLTVNEPEELHQLSKILNGMAAKIADRLNALTEQRNEFEAMLEGMVESVIVLDPELSILDVNGAAVRLARPR